MGIDQPLTEPDAAPSGRPPSPPVRIRRYLTVAGVVLLGLVGLTATSLAGLRLVQRGEVLPGVSVEGVDIGGLSPADAEAALAELVAARQTDPVVFTLGDDRFQLDPSTIAHNVDVAGTVDTAMSLGRQRGFIGNTMDHVRAHWLDRDLPLQADHDADALRGWIDELAAQLDQESTIGAVTVDPQTLEVQLELPEDGVTVRQEETEAAVLEALLSPGPDQLALPADIDPTPITEDAVREVGRQAERAVAAPLTLTSPETDASLTLAPEELARLISLHAVNTGSEDETVELVATADAVEEVVGDRGEDFRVEPVSARFQVPRTPPTTHDDKDTTSWRPRPAQVDIVPASDGWEFDASMASTQLTELLQQGRRQAELRLAKVEPELTTARAEELQIDELLGTFTTYHKCCQNRVHNIQKLADMVDHTLVLPGEQFSINQISGNRTCAKGFVEDGMILNGEVVPVCGGGVSQFGTTTVNAVFFSGLDPDTYKPHSFYISRYPMGREATLNYPSPDIDVRFTNDTGYGILVKTSYTTTSITVSFYGHNDVAEVTAIHGEPYNFKPYKTRERINRDLPPQTRRVVQGGQDGFSIKVTRVITYADGSETRDDWSNVYVPEVEIIEYNPAPRPKPEPEPEPEPEPSPSPTPTESPTDGDSGGGG